jgi:hypothetical protein
LVGVSAKDTPLVADPILDDRRGIGGKALERRGVRRWRGGSHRWWHRIFTYSSVNSVLFGTHSILLMRSPFSAMTLFFSPHKEEARAVDRPIFTTGSTYHPMPCLLPDSAALCLQLCSLQFSFNVCSDFINRAKKRG